MNVTITLILVAPLLVINVLGIWLIATGSSVVRRILSLIASICLILSASVVALKLIDFFNMLGLYNPIYPHGSNFTVLNLSAVVAIWALVGALYLAVANAPRLGEALTVLSKIADGVEDLLRRIPKR